MRFCAPGYIYPTLTEFDILIETLQRGDIVVCNVDSGPGPDEPHTDRSKAWRTRVLQIHAKGASAIGYVPVGHFMPNEMGQDGRPASYGEILRWSMNWITWYGVAGIWYDEMNHADVVPFSQLQGLHGMARRGAKPNTHGLYRLGLSVWNPGCYPTDAQYPTYHDRLARLPGSLWCTFENNADTYLSLKPKPRLKQDAEREIHLVHSCRPRQVMPVKSYAATLDIGYGSMTADSGDNPYDTAASRLG